MQADQAHDFPVGPYGTGSWPEMQSQEFDLDPAIFLFSFIFFFFFSGHEPPIYGDISVN